MIYLELVNEKTFKKVVDMQLDKEQKKLVAPNVVSLAQAWLYYDEAKPYAILNDNRVVGFMMLDWDEKERTVGLWRFMIAKEEQGKGYGKEAVKAFLDLVKKEKIFDIVFLDYVKGNTVARNLYASFGFLENGDIEDGEIVMTLPLTDSPKVGYTIADMDDLNELLNISSDIKKEDLKDAILHNEVKRYTILGKAIGFTIKEKLFIDEKFIDRRKEIMEII